MPTAWMSIPCSSMWRKRSSAFSMLHSGSVPAVGASSCVRYSRNSARETAVDDRRQDDAIHDNAQDDCSPRCPRTTLSTHAVHARLPFRMVHGTMKYGNNFASRGLAHNDLHSRPWTGARASCFAAGPDQSVAKLSKRAIRTIRGPRCHKSNVAATAGDLRTQFEPVL